MPTRFLRALALLLAGLEHRLLHGGTELVVGGVELGLERGDLGIAGGEVSLELLLGLGSGFLARKVAPGSMPPSGELGDLLVPRGGCILEFALRIRRGPLGALSRGGAGELERLLLLELHMLLALVQLARELTVADLLGNVCIAGFIHLEHLTAVGAFNLVHRSFLSSGVRRANRMGQA